MVLYDRLKYCCGSIIYALSSAKARKAVEEDFTVSLHLKPVKERLMRFYIAEKHAGCGNDRELIDLHKRFWGGHSGRTYHQVKQKKVPFSIKPEYEAVFKAASACAARRRLSTLLEIGCGNGDLLRFLAGIMPDCLEHFVGLDLSREQIEANSRDNIDPRLTFIHADADNWMAANTCSDTLVITHDGVLEYFSENMIDRLFRHLSSANNCLMLIESIATDADLARQEHSLVFGSEYSFSHNYPRLLSVNRFSILYQEEQIVEKYRMLLLLAAAPVS